MEYKLLLLLLLCPQPVGGGLSGAARHVCDDFCASQAAAVSDDFPSSQPAAAAPVPVARFTLLPAGNADSAPFQLRCSASATLQLGREVPEHALPADVPVAFLTPRHDIGISRNQGMLRFDGTGIVLDPII